MLMFGLHIMTVCKKKLNLFFVCLVIRQDGEIPTKYGLTMDMEAKYSDIKPFLSRHCNIPSQNLILVDILQAQFRVSSLFLHCGTVSYRNTLKYLPEEENFIV